MRKRMIQSLVTLIFTSLLFIGITLAWFITSINNQVEEIQIVVTSSDFEYSFYYFRSTTYQGNNGLTLYDHLCEDALDTECFVEFDQTTPNILSTNRSTRPSHQFSFALDVKNITSTNRELVVSIAELLSLGFDLDSNQIQRAFQYQVTKVSFFTDEEGIDIKDTLSIEYAGKSGVIPHFGLTPNAEYILLSDLLLTSSGANQRTILYFTIRFDPEIKGLDEFGQSTNNSNAFQNQTFRIRKLKVEAVLPS